MKKLIISLMLLFGVNVFGQLSMKITEEDDFFTAIQPNRDRYYSQGICLSVSPDAEDIFSFGQLMYTPDIITIPTKQIGDHPWVGLLYGEYSRRWFDTNIVNTLSLTMGVTGPDSLAGQTQTWFHKLIGCHQPKGWDNQLGGDFVANLTYQHSYKFWNTTISDIELEFWNEERADFGILYDGIRDSPELRIGINLPQVDPSPILIKGKEPISKWRGWVSMGPNVNLVGYNYFLEGSPFYSDPNCTGITERPIVFGFNMGLHFSVPIGSSELFGGYSYYWISDEYYGQASSEGYGSLTIGCGKSF
jgi:hypothetical protein